MPHQRLRPMLTAPGLKLGLFAMEFATPGLPLLVKHGGADFLVLDLEHSGFGFETMRAVTIGGRAADLPVIVRVPHLHPNEVSRALDGGADGIMAPLVSTGQQARDVVAWATYPPSGGMRGVGMMLPHDNYRPGVPAAKMAEADATRAIIIQIETREGAENAEAIAAVPGVDCLWLGHMDLSCSLGIPGRFDHPDFVEACGRVFAAAKRHGKALGRMAGGIAEAKRLAEEGYDTIALFSDTAALQERIAEGVAALRGSA